MKTSGWLQAGTHRTCFAVAAVPRAGLSSLAIYKTRGGAEFVAINPDTHAIRRFNMNQDIKAVSAHSLLKAYQDEGHRLNSQIRVFQNECELYGHISPLCSEIVRQAPRASLCHKDCFFIFDNVCHTQATQARTPASLLAGEIVVEVYPSLTQQNLAIQEPR
jgi:hypothetical protein